tara:strand:+ start:4594 stop:5175 length:582 start_codon:yes stop_codon:yes gene_type:complete
MALSYCNIQVELREISLRDRPQSLYDISKKGTVPVILTKNKNVIDESLDIMIWALKKKNNQTWLNKDNKEIDLINFNDTEFKKWLDKYKYHDRYPENSKESYRDKCNIILAKYENNLNNNQYLMSNKISIADIAIFPFIRQFANVDYKWFENNYFNLNKWLNNISSSKLFISIMNKYNTWDKNEEPMIIRFNQ